MARLVLELNRDELSALQYPVVVERWDSVAGKGAGGKQHRAYLAEFTETERKKVHELYNLFYRWYLVTGTPEKYLVGRPSDIQFMKRVCNFFGTV